MNACAAFSAALTEEMHSWIGASQFSLTEINDKTTNIDLKIKSETDEEDFWSMQSRCVSRAHMGLYKSLEG